METHSTLDSLQLRLGSPQARFGALFSLIFVGSGSLVLGGMLGLGPFGWGGDVPAFALMIMLVIGVAHFGVGLFGFVRGSSGLRVELGLQRVRIVWTVFGFPVRWWTRELSEVSHVQRRGSLLCLDGSRSLRVWLSPFPSSDASKLVTVLQGTLTQRAVTGEGAAPAELMALLGAASE